MKLEDFTIAQLDRMYARLYPTGCGAWDWPTLRLTYPARAIVMRSILCIIARKEKQS